MVPSLGRNRLEALTVVLGIDIGGVRLVETPHSPGEGRLM